MIDRLNRIDEKLDRIQSDMQTLVLDAERRLVKLETTQRGIIALCAVLITSALGALAKALHLS